MHPLLHGLIVCMLAAVSSWSILALGLLCLAWWFRETNPGPWRHMSARPHFYAVDGLVAFISTTVLFWHLNPRARMGMLCVLVVTQLVALLAMSYFVSSPPRKKAVDPEV